MRTSKCARRHRAAPKQQWSITRTTNGSCPRKLRTENSDSVHLSSSSICLSRCGIDRSGHHASTPGILHSNLPAENCITSCHEASLSTSAKHQDHYTGSNLAIAELAHSACSQIGSLTTSHTLSCLNLLFRSARYIACTPSTFIPERPCALFCEIADCASLGCATMHMPSEEYPNKAKSTCELAEYFNAR